MLLSVDDYQRKKRWRGCYNWNGAELDIINTESCLAILYYQLIVICYVYRGSQVFDESFIDN